MRQRTVAILSLLPLSVLLGGCCKQSVDLRILVGHKTAVDCRTIFAQNLDAPTSIVCKAEEVTLCWVSNVDQVTFDQGIGVKPGTGVDYYTPAGDVTITAKASDCASVSKSVKVITQPTPFTFDAAWDAKCQSIYFDIDPNFVSNHVYAIDITPNWTPVIQDPNGNAVQCTTPPFLAGFQQQENFGFQLTLPFNTVAFSRKLHAVGHWTFALKAQCPVNAADGFVCNRYASLPFDLTLACF